MEFNETSKLISLEFLNDIEFYTRLEEYFLLFKEKMINNYIQSMNRLYEKNILPQKPFEDNIKNREEEFNKIDNNETKIAHITNNFYGLFPTGFKRILLQDAIELYKDDLTKETIGTEKYEKLLKQITELEGYNKLYEDLDNILNKMNWNNKDILNLIFDKTSSGDSHKKRMYIIGKVFFEMLDLNYDENLLWR